MNKPLPDPRLARREFLHQDDVRALLAQRGWTVALLAEHWALRKQYLYRLIENYARAPHWDDAFRGLPPCPVKARRPGRPPKSEAAGKPALPRDAASRAAAVAPQGNDTRRRPESPSEERKRLLQMSAVDIDHTLARFGRIAPDHLAAGAIPTRGVFKAGQVVLSIDDFQGRSPGVRGVVIDVIERLGLGEQYRIALEDRSVVKVLPHQALALFTDVGETRDLSALDLSTDLLVRHALADGSLKI